MPLSPTLVIRRTDNILHNHCKSRFRPHRGPPTSNNFQDPLPPKPNNPTNSGSNHMAPSQPAHSNPITHQPSNIKRCTILCALARPPRHANGPPATTWHTSPNWAKRYHKHIPKRPDRRTDQVKKEGGTIAKTPIESLYEGSKEATESALMLYSSNKDSHHHHHHHHY